MARLSCANKGMFALPGKWVYYLKTDTDGTVEKYWGFIIDCANNQAITNS
jgi:hypothetical protein